MDFSRFSQEKIMKMFYDKENKIRDIEGPIFQSYLNQLCSQDQHIEDFDTYAKNMMMLQYIAYHTAKMNPGEITTQDRALLRAGFVRQFRRTERGFKFFDWQNNEIEIKKLSTIKSFKKRFPHLNDFQKRTGSCHHDSMLVALMTGNDDCKVVTGYTTSLAKEHTILHSWVEFTSANGIERVADFTFNAIMNKDDYYRLRNASPQAELSREQLIFDIETGFINSEPIQNIDYKVFLLYHDEIFDDFQQNPDFYLKPNNSSKSPQTTAQEQSQPQ